MKKVARIAFLCLMLSPVANAGVIDHPATPAPPPPPPPSGQSTTGETDSGTLAFVIAALLWELF